MSLTQAFQAYTQQRSQDDEEYERQIKKKASLFNLEEDPEELATNEMNPDEDFGVSNSFSGESLYSFSAKTGQTKMKPNLNGVEAQAILDLVSSQEGAIVNNGANLLITSKGKKLFETDENGVVTFSIAQHDQNFSRRQNPISNSMELLKGAMQSRIQVESHTKEDIEIGTNGNQNSKGVKKPQTPPSTAKQSTQRAETEKQTAAVQGAETEQQTATGQPAPSAQSPLITSTPAPPVPPVPAQSPPITSTPAPPAPAQSPPITSTPAPPAPAQSPPITSTSAPPAPAQSPPITSTPAPPAPAQSPPITSTPASPAQAKPTTSLSSVVNTVAGAVPGIVTGAATILAASGAPITPGTVAGAAAVATLATLATNTSAPAPPTPAQSPPITSTPAPPAPAQSPPMTPLLGTDEKKISITREELNILGKYYRSPEYKQSNPGVVVSKKTNTLDDYKSAHIDAVRTNLNNPNFSVQKMNNMKPSPEAKITMTNGDIENLQKAQEWQRTEEQKANTLKQEGNREMEI